jgi:hypothetical protein
MVSALGSSLRISAEIRLGPMAIEPLRESAHRRLIAGTCKQTIMSRRSGSTAAMSGCCMPSCPCNSRRPLRALVTSFMRQASTA